MEQPQLVASFLGGEGAVAEARDEAVVACLAVLLPLHEHGCRPYVHR